jgi:hypothetical protein
MKKNTNSVYELIKVIFIIVVLGASLGAIYASDLKPELKIIFAGFFVMLTIIANEISRVFNINFLISELQGKILLQLALMGKKQGVKEDLSKIWDEMEDAEIKKINFQKKLTGNIDLIIYIILILAVTGVGMLTVSLL